MSTGYEPNIEGAITVLVDILTANGGYKGEKTEGQKSLKRWGDQKWMTRDEYEKKD
jgi:hypothetical protein